MEKYGPLGGRKYSKNNKDSQIGQVTAKTIFKKEISLSKIFYITDLQLEDTIIDLTFLEENNQNKVVGGGLVELYVKNDHF